MQFQRAKHAGFLIQLFNQETVLVNAPRFSGSGLRLGNADDSQRHRRRQNFLVRRQRPQLLKQRCERAPSADGLPQQLQIP